MLLEVVDVRANRTLVHTASFASWGAGNEGALFNPLAGVCFMLVMKQLR